MPCFRSPSSPQLHDETIELFAHGLPPGVTLDAASIPAGTDGALVTVRRGNEPPGSSGRADSPEARRVSERNGVAIVGFRGRAADGAEQSVTIKDHPLAPIQPWLASEVALALTSARASDFQVDWKGLPADTGFFLASRLNLPVKVSRPADKDIVRLTLLTSQRQALLNGQPDPNQMLRLEKPVELPAGASDGAALVLVPPRLSAPVYDVTVQAELLAPTRRPYWPSRMHRAAHGCAEPTGCATGRPSPAGNGVESKNRRHDRRSRARRASWRRVQQRFGRAYRAAEWRPPTRLP